MVMMLPLTSATRPDRPDVYRWTPQGIKTTMMAASKNLMIQLLACLRIKLNIKIFSSRVQGSEVQGSEVQGSEVQGSGFRGSEVQGFNNPERRTLNREPYPIKNITKI
jgi:hypothetical protein